jgi:hypothetical protein
MDITTCVLSLFLHSPNIREICGKTDSTFTPTPTLRRQGSAVVYHFADPRQVNIRFENQAKWEVTSQHLHGSGVFAKCRFLSPLDGRHPGVPNPKGINYLLRTTAETIHSQVTTGSVTYSVADSPKIHECFRLRNCRHRTTNASPRGRLRTLVTHLHNVGKYVNSTELAHSYDHRFSGCDDNEPDSAMVIPMPVYTY